MDVTDTRDYLTKVKETAEFIVNRVGSATVAVVLGSGLNNFTDELTNPKELHYSEIPHVPRPTVKGHSGKLVTGEIGGRKVICLAGRSHAYEGRHAYELTFLARVLKLVGCKVIISTNASGGAQEGMYPGCLMIIRDHINFYHRNPLADTCEFAPLGEHNPDMTNVYSERITEIARTVSKRVGVKLFEGVYGGTSGPTYETPSEVRSYTTFGAGAFGMSTMPEAMAIKALKMESFAISLITNMASGLSKEVLTHAGVTAVASESGPAFVRFMKEFLVEVTELPDANDALPALSESTVITPLPQPQYPAIPKKSMMITSHGAVKDVAGPQEVSIAVLLSNGHEKFLDSLTQTSSMNLNAIPHFPQITASRHAKLVFGNTKNGRRVVAIVGSALEGFACEEATFVVELLADLGVKIFLQTFVSATSHAEEKTGEIVVLNDLLDTTTIHPYPTRVNITDYNLKTDFFNTKFVEDLKKLDGKAVEGTYCHIAGPTYPTAAEVNISRILGHKSVGITSLACLFSAKALGLEVVGLAENVFFRPSEAKATTEILRLASTFVDTTEIPALRPVTMKEECSGHQISWHLPPPVIQGFYDQVIESATFIKDKIKSSAAIALVLEKDFQDLPLNNFVVFHEFKASEIPHMKNVPGSLQFGELAGVPVYVSRGMNVATHEGVPTNETSSFIRVLATLDARKILFVSAICAVNSDLKIGDLSVISDHVLLSGRNSLFGPNEDRWGTRFPDVGEAYNKEFQKVLFDSAMGLEIPALSVVFGHFVGPIYRSPATARYSQTMGLQAISTGLAQEVLVARHMSVSVGAVGVVTASLVAGKEAVAESKPAFLSEFVEKSVKAAYQM